MFPNPQDALPLPPRPSLEQYKKRAKDLVKACQSRDLAAIRIWTEKWLKSLAALQGSRQLRAWLQDKLDEVETFARNQLSHSAVAGTKCALADAQFVIARSHGFQSWPKFTKHLDELGQKNSPVCNFELAAEAIVSGDMATLKRLLQENPALVKARSTREHKATLLHYVSANGVEGYRPANAKECSKDR